MSTDESRTERGPAGDAFLALVRAFEPLLLWNEEMVVAQERRLERELRFTGGGDPLGLEEQLAPIREAVRLGRAAYDRLGAHGPEVADGAARLVATLYLAPLRMREDVREFAEPLNAALRKLTEQPKAAPREKS
jgi:hypothetical protein